MTSEEKLNHLKDWMDIWIADRIMKLEWYSNMINFYNETGNIMLNTGDIPIPSFEEYLVTRCGAMRYY